MCINKNDFVEGLEYYGQTIKSTKGWVNDIRNFEGHISYRIQADDASKGARETILFSELGEVKKLIDKERP